jgi:hypothetical protein
MCPNPVDGCVSLAKTLKEGRWHLNHCQHFVLTVSNKLSSILLFRLDVVIAPVFNRKGLRDSFGVTDFLCIMTLLRGKIFGIES